MNDLPHEALFHCIPPYVDCDSEPGSVNEEGAKAEYAIGLASSWIRISAFGASTRVSQVTVLQQKRELASSHL